MSFTCISCHVAFKEASIQREHYKTDWHRYNLKRKVVDLPPVTAEVFQERVLEQRFQSAQQEAAQSFSAYCGSCKKKFKSAKSYENHQQSKKHQENLLLTPLVEAGQKPQEKDDNYTTDEDIEEVSSDEWEDEEKAIPLTACLFCKHRSQTIEENCRHMSDEHSFFIPDMEFVTDVEGLLTYLGERIGQGHICLWCGHMGRQFSTTEAVQKHMVDKGHCKMFHQGEALLEYSDFYDYSTSYPDAGDAEEEVEENVLDSSGFELILPSGASIGHRSLSRYYRQKLNPNPRPQVARSAIQYGNCYRALGWNSSSSQELRAQKAKDIGFMKKILSKQHLRLGVKSNKLQKHFRQQVDF